MAWQNTMSLTSKGTSKGNIWAIFGGSC